MTITETPTNQTNPSPTKEHRLSTKIGEDPEPTTGPETLADAGSQVPTSSLSPNPANPRNGLGDLTEMVRSIKAHGVLQPLLVLPASEDGEYRIVAGHRRHAAALKAGLDSLPVVIADLNEAEILEVMLIENGLREDLTLSEEISTLEALMTLDVGYTPRKLCARIGKSQRWIKDRLAVTVLATQWRDRLDSKELSLSAAVAASTLADLGPEHIDQVCHELTHSRNYRDPASHVEFYRKDLKVRQEAETLAAKLTSKGVTIYDDKAEIPDRVRTLRILGFDSDQAKAHVKEPCHAVGVRPGYNAGPQLTPYCNDPKRHRTSKTEPAESAIVAPPAPGHSRADAAQQQERRKGRVARLAAGTELFARTTKKPKLHELRNLALYSLITSTGEGAKKHALKILSIKANNDTDSTTDLLTAAAAQSPQTLVRVASAIACGIAEERAYHSESSMVTGYMSFLVRNGWEPDATTADILDRHEH